jgi:ABC-type transporter Mla subunit MlaD
MDENIRAKITQRLERLPDETARQLLDYIEFLESKYNRSTRDRSALERLAENVEDTLRVSRIGGAAIRGTAQVLDAASTVVRGVADAGRVVVEELQRLDTTSDDARPESQQALEQAREESSPKLNHAAEPQPDAVSRAESVTGAGDRVSAEDAGKQDHGNASQSEKEDR